MMHSETTLLSSSRRLDSIDLLRGIVMIIMALDHSRDFFHSGAAQFDPTDLTRTNVLLFFTRWITHFCAPLFVFLAGTGVFLSLSRGKSRSEMSKFLVTRGLWLIVLELTVVRFGWAFNLDYESFTVLQVIWVIGISMIVLAGLIHIPLSVTAGIGGVMILFHNMLDGIQAARIGLSDTVWNILHVQGLISVLGIQVFVIYPLIPWIGVMALGYVFGSVMIRPANERKTILVRIGLSAIGAFIVVRGINVYGDFSHWVPQDTLSFTFLSFINTTKYPPSLLFLLMTLGPAILALPLLEKWKNGFTQRIIVFGRVPMFYYVLHIFLLHTMGGIFSYARYGDKAFSFNPLNLPSDYGYDLWVTYVMWLAAIIILYPLCKRYAELKKKNKYPLLSYL